MEKGCFLIYEENELVGEMTYTWVGDSKFIIDHTEVKDTFGGKGIAKQLVLVGIAFARDKNLKIIPLCPYAKKVFDSNEELNDVRF